MSMLLLGICTRGGIEALGRPWTIRSDGLECIQNLHSEPGPTMHGVNSFIWNSPGLRTTCLEGCERWPGLLQCTATHATHANEGEPDVHMCDDTWLRDRQDQLTAQ